MSLDRVPMADVETQVVHRDGKVMMLFSRRNSSGELEPAKPDHLMLDPPRALEAAELLSAMAFEADTSLKPVGETLKASLIDKHRDKLIPVIATILRTYINQKKTPGQMALSIMDEVCKEIFA